MLSRPVRSVIENVPIVEHGRPVGILSAKDALSLDALQFEVELVRREEITVIL